MIRPKIVPYLPVKQIIVILSHTDIYYQVMPLMPFFEISGNIINRVTICFLQPGSWICHCYHSLSDIGHVQVHILPNRPTFRPRNYFTYKFYHLFIYLLYHTFTNLSSIVKTISWIKLKTKKTSFMGLGSSHKKSSEKYVNFFHEEIWA